MGYRRREVSTIFVTKYVERFQNTPASTDAVKKLASEVNGDRIWTISSSSGSSIPEFRK